MSDVGGDAGDKPDPCSKVWCLFVVVVTAVLEFRLDLRTIEVSRVTRHIVELVGSGRLCRCSGSERSSLEVRHDAHEVLEAMLSEKVFCCTLLHKESFGADNDDE